MVFSGVDQFWKTVAILEQNREPNSEEWNALFSAPGYRYYFTDSRDEANSFKKRMELVFMPSNSAALQDTLKSVEGELDFSLRPLYALLQAKERQQELKLFQQKLAASNLSQQAVNEAARLLPKGSEAAVPPILFNIYKLDATGTPDRIIFDFVLAEKLGQKWTLLTMAHEAHHAVRDNLSELNIPEKGDDPRYYLLVALNQLQAEGIADRIDKEYGFSEDLRKKLAQPTTAMEIWLKEFLLEFYAKKFKEAYNSTPKTLQRVDSLIATAARAEANNDEEILAETAESVYRSLPINAHPNGYFMANTIAQQLGEEALVEEVANPFSFIRLYNRAIQKSDELKPFSEETMIYLGKLEQKYIKNNQ